MKPTVYVDILFITNFITDFFLLYMTRAACKSKSPIWRLSCGACIGSIYAVLMFYPDLSIFYSSIFKLIISGAIVFISFKTRSKREFLLLFAVFYMSGFVLAGITFALFYFTDIGSRVGAAMSNGVFYVNINPMHLFLGAALCYIVMFLGEKIYIKKFNTNMNIHTLKITYGSKTVHIKALLDTANAMSDPITNTPVIVCTIDALKPLFNEESFYRKLCEAQKTDSDKLKVELVCDTPFRLVPYRAIGAVADVMLAFVPSSIEIDEKEYEKGALIGLCAQTLSQTFQYDALLHPRIMVGL